MASTIRLKKKLTALAVHGRSIVCRPKPFDFACKEKRAVVVVCHPDDETFCSGLICSLLAKKWRVSLVCATRGEGAKLKNTTEEIAELRTEEMINAARILGVEHVEFLNLPDSGRHGMCSNNAAETLERLKNVFRDIQPSVVLTHGRDGEYGHPGHLMTREICFDAVTANAPKASVLGMNAARLAGPMRHLRNNTAPADFFVDGRDHSDVRLAALTQHKSQSFVFADWAGSVEAFIGTTEIEYYSIDKPARLGDTL